MSPIYTHVFEETEAEKMGSEAGPDPEEAGSKGLLVLMWPLSPNVVESVKCSHAQPMALSLLFLSL